MVIASTEPVEGEQAVLLGLSRNNIEALMAGRHIVANRKSHGDAVPDGITLLIMFGETEKDIADALRTQGIVGPQTRVN